MNRSKDSAEYRHHDELFFQPLTLDQCWSRAYHWVFRKHFDLFLKLGLSASLPVAFLVLLPSYTYDYIEFGIVEVLLLALSISVANGPVMVAVAEVYAGHDRQREKHRDDASDTVDDDSWWWYECYAVFVRQNITSHNPASRKRRIILGKTIGGGLLAVAMVSVASYFLYVPGVYLAIRWYFVPCILFFDQTSMRESFRRSYYVATSSSPTPQERGSGAVLADRRKGIFGIKLEVFCILIWLFLMELLPTLLLGIVSVLTRQITDVLFDHDKVANFLGLALYTIGTTAHKSLLVPFAIVLKTIMYLNLRITNENLTGNDFRSLLRDKGLELESFSGGDDDDNEPERSLLTANEGIKLKERVTASAV